jgi:hypothetical protein
MSSTAPVAVEMTEAEFRAQALAFLDANAERRRPPDTAAWGSGSDRVGIFRERTIDEDRHELSAGAGSDLGLPK